MGFPHTTNLEYYAVYHVCDIGEYGPVVLWTTTLRMPSDFVKLTGKNFKS